MVPPAGVPPALVPNVPQLPFAADPGTITGWILDATATKMSESISLDLERGFNRLVTNVPAHGNPAYDATMQEMTANSVNDVVPINVLHSIGCYSAGFGGSNTLHGQTLALLGEKVDTQLPPLVRCNVDPEDDLAHGLAMEGTTVPSGAQVDAYFNAPGHLDLTTHQRVQLGSTNMNLSNICPLPTAWAPYFMDYKSPYEALKTGRLLIAGLPMVKERTRAAPLLDWLQAACVRLGHTAENWIHSLVDQSFASTPPDARAVRWMTTRVSRYQKELLVLPTLTPPPEGESSMHPARSTRSPLSQVNGNTPNWRHQRYKQPAVSWTPNG
jgi:hypothetical protein